MNIPVCFLIVVGILRGVLLTFLYVDLTSGNFTELVLVLAVCRFSCLS